MTQTDGYRCFWIQTTAILFNDHAQKKQESNQNVMAAFP